MNNNIDLERKSSAVTLSDMEMFIFPELIYSLVLANIMSPRIWKWREDPWFAGIERMKPYRRITRLKQFIMDHYVFNLDLDTWGLTTKERELARFREFIDEETLSRSNALFGYEGDKYYFDIDIRTHFGLDKYEGNIIPYWKTETVEAMDAFIHKPNYSTGAGECVSLSTLYAAALFIVAGIPLEDIYLMATPLHSQNFLDIEDGILTNNRRLVTKNMWCNGTPLSAQARRALENERVTIVAHETGCIHTVYGEASIDPGIYNRYSDRLKAFLKTDLTIEIFGNFLRNNTCAQKCFQLRWSLPGGDNYIGLERVFAYERSSPYRITDNTRPKLMAEIETEEFNRNPLCNRIILNDLEEFVAKEKIDIGNPADVKKMRNQFSKVCLDSESAMEALINFCHVKPRLPDPREKIFVPAAVPLGLEIDMTREEIMEQLSNIRESNITADLAFYAYRDLSVTDPESFLHAAIRRCPVSVEATLNFTIGEIVALMETMPDDSIYDGISRLAQPDEVWNYARGNGLEKAVLLANIIRHRRPDTEIYLETTGSSAILKTGREEYIFESSKLPGEHIWTIPGLA